MDPARRILIKVRLDDAMKADEIEPRRQFIEENAKYVQNLDI